MSSFLDRLGLHRRQEPRVAVDWLIDVQVRGTDHYVGFQALDVSRSGMRLEALDPDSLERVRSPKGIPMRLRLPPPYGAIEFEAQLKWEREEDGKLLRGWGFTRISRQARKAISDYIEAHPEDVLESPPEKE